MNIKYLDIALEEANKAYNEGEIPIGAVIVKNNEIIAQQHNLKEKYNCSTRHAELLAIEQASSVLNDWRLNDCEMYITMEPCIMCSGALIQSRIKRVYYLVDNQKFGGVGSTKEILDKDQNNHHVEIIKIDDKNRENQMSEILKKFFSDKR